MDFPILSTLIFLPLVSSLFIFLSKGQNNNSAIYISLFSSLATFILSLFIWYSMDYSSADFQFLEEQSWINDFIKFKLGIDGISILFIVLTTLITPICIISCINSVKDRVKEFLIAIMILETFMIGVFCSLDLVVFYLFFEAGLIPMFLIIGVWGGPRRVYSAFKFFLFTLLGSVLMLVAIIAIYWITGTTDVTQIYEIKIPKEYQNLLWLAFFSSFAVKTPMWPVHTWLPDAHVEAPTAISVLLAGILLKLGVYGIIRVNYGIMPNEVYWFAGGLAFLGLVNVIWGGLCALAQTDLKKLVAYSSINHMGYSLLGMAAVVAAGAMNGGDLKAAQAGLSGAVFQMFNHGTISAMLFILVGVVYERAHHRDIDGFGGLASQMPVYTGITALAFFAGLGLPGFSGFVSEAMCFIGAFPVFRTIVILSTIGILLNAAYFLWAFQRVFFGKLNEKYKDMEEINGLELFTVIPLAVITLFFGIYPGPYLDLIKATMDQIIEKVEFVATYDSV